jgi:hypothetical protein
MHDPLTPPFILSCNIIAYYVPSMYYSRVQLARYLNGRHSCQHNQLYSSDLYVIPRPTSSEIKIAFLDLIHLKSGSTKTQDSLLKDCQVSDLDCQY